jgi:hypothetical protein
MGADLPPVVDQRGVVGSCPDPGADHPLGGVELLRREAGLGEKPQLANVARGSGDPIPVKATASSDSDSDAFAPIH